MDTGQAGMDEWTDMFIDSIAPKKKKKSTPTRTVERFCCTLAICQHFRIPESLLKAT